MSQPPRPTSAPGRRRVSPPSIMGGAPTAGTGFIGGQLHTPPELSWSVDDPEMEGAGTTPLGGAPSGGQNSSGSSTAGGDVGGFGESLSSLASWGVAPGGSSSVMNFDDGYPSSSSFQQPPQQQQQQQQPPPPKHYAEDPPDFMVPQTVPPLVHSIPTPVGLPPPQEQAGAASLLYDNSNNNGDQNQQHHHHHHHGPPGLPRAVHPHHHHHQQQQQQQQELGTNSSSAPAAAAVHSVLFGLDSAASSGMLLSPELSNTSDSFNNNGAPSPVPAPAYQVSDYDESAAAASLNFVEDMIKEGGQRAQSAPSDISAAAAAAANVNPVSSVLSQLSGGRSGRRLRDILKDAKLKDVTVETIRDALNSTGVHTHGVRNAVWTKLDAADAAAAPPSSVSVDAPDARWSQFCSNLCSTIKNSKASSSSATELNVAAFVLTEATKFLRNENRLQRLQLTEGAAARSAILDAKEEARVARDALLAAQQQVSDLHLALQQLREELDASRDTIRQLEDVRHNLQLGIARTASKVLGAVVVGSGSNEHEVDEGASEQRNRASNDNNANDDEDENGAAGSISVKHPDPEYYLTFLEGIAAETSQLRLEMDAALFVGTQQTDWAIKEGQEGERMVQRLQAAKDQLGDCSLHMFAMRTHISRLEQQLGPLREREYELQASEHALRYHDSVLWSSFAFNGLTGAHAESLETAVRSFLRSATQCQGKVSISSIPEAGASLLDTAIQRHNNSLTAAAISGAGSPTTSGVNASASVAILSSALSATSAAKDSYATLPQQLLGGGIPMLQMLDGIALAHRKVAQGNGLVVEPAAVLAQAREILSHFPSWPEGRVHPASVTSSATPLYDGLLRSVLAGSGASFPNYVPAPPSSPSKARQRVAGEYACALLAAIQREGLCGYSECFLVHAVATAQAPIGALRALPRLAERLFVRLQSNVSSGGGGGGGGASLLLAGASGAGGTGTAAGAPSSPAPPAPPPPRPSKKAGGASVVPRDQFLRTVRDMFPRAAEASILALALVTFAAQERVTADLHYVPFFKDKEHAAPGMVLSAVYRVALDEQRHVVGEIQHAVAQMAWKRFLAQKESEDELVEDEVDSSSAGSSTVPTARSAAGTAATSARPGSPDSGSTAAAAMAATAKRQQQQQSSSARSGKSGKGGPKAAQPHQQQQQSMSQLTDDPYSKQALVSLRDIGIAVFQVNPHCSHREMSKIVSVAAADEKIEADYMMRMKTVASASIGAATSGLSKQPIEMAVLNKMVRMDEAFRRIRSTLFLEITDKMNAEE